MKDITTFTATINNEDIIINCTTIITKNGFAHKAQSVAGNRKVSATKAWSNRTWEDFKYEMVLRKIIGKFPTSEQDELTHQIVDKRIAEDTAEMERFNECLERVIEARKQLSSETQQHLSEIEISDKEQMENIMNGCELLGFLLGM